MGSECPLCQQDRGWTGVSAAQDWTSGRGRSGHALPVLMGHTKPARHCKQPTSLPHPCPHSISTRGPSLPVHHRRWSLCDAGLRSCPHPPVGRWPAPGTGHGGVPSDQVLRCTHKGRDLLPSLLAQVVSLMISIKQEETLKGLVFCSFPFKKHDIHASFLLPTVPQRGKKEGRGVGEPSALTPRGCSPGPHSAVGMSTLQLSLILTFRSEVT